MKRRLLIGLTALAGACVLDPVPDERSADLGDEVPGIEKGPFHRAGQPCLACHDGSRADPEMTVGGTIYAVRGSNTPIANADVVFTDANGGTALATTNAVGNFFIYTSQWQPTFPLHVQINYPSGTTQPTAAMNSIIGRDGSCASCHADPQSRISAGPVYVAPDPLLLPDAGAP